MGKETHGMARTKLYKKWTAMLSRCRNPKDPNYRNYGARGISVEARWFEFENFYADMGNIPFEEAEIDRIDNQKGYGPEKL